MYKTQTACLLCERCVRAIRSRGEKIFVGDEIYDRSGTCHWCDDVDDVFYNVIFAVELERV